MTTEDKLDRLAAALDVVEVHVRTVDASARRSEKNRLNMLHLHAAAAVLIGILFCLLDPSSVRGPNWVVIRMIPGATVSLGALLAAGGLILGPATWYRHLYWEKIGLWMVLAWYATIALSFATGTLLWLAGENPSATAPAFYAPLVYLHLSCVMIVHLVTLSRISRTQRYLS